MQYTITLNIDDAIATDAIDILASNFGYNAEEDGDKTAFVLAKEETYLKELIMTTISNAKRREAKKAMGIYRKTPPVRVNSAKR